MSRIVLLAFVAAAALACGFASTARADENEIVVEKGITFCEVDGVELKLDLARPKGDGPFPLIVFVHGGGWFMGDRAAYSKEIEEAARRGFAAATVSYRLMKLDEKTRKPVEGTPIFPAQVHDVKAAVRWLRANAEKYHIDPDRVGATGGSAGGHLSLMLGLTDKESGLEGNGGHLDQSSRVQAVVNIVGPTEMVSCCKGSTEAWIFTAFMGGEPDEAPENYKASSPLTYVSKDDPPVLTLHGKLDILVPVQQAELLDKKMKEVGASHTLVIYEKQGHGFTGKDHDDAMERLWGFFAEVLK